MVPENGVGSQASGVHPLFCQRFLHPSKSFDAAAHVPLPAEDAPDWLFHRTLPGQMRKIL